jgi:site-specific DNA-cytosine methylase
VDYTDKSPTCLSTVTGMRGIERGLDRAFDRIGWKKPNTIAYVEIEAFAIYNLVKQMEKGLLAPAPVWSNLKTFKWELLRGKVDWLTGGYPCQPFSTAGKQLGSKDPRHLWPYYEKGINVMRPIGCFFENVRQHLNNGYREVKQSLEGLNYTVREGIYSAQEIGASHKRDRLFILALDNAYCVKPGSLNGNPNQMFSIQEKECQPEYSTVISGRTSFKELADTDIRRQQQRNNAGMGRPRELGERFRFPANPGQPQHNGEPERTIKSSVGFTINGYDFTEDLLRLAGNGVVEQCAEFAFIDLLNKFYPLFNDRDNT